MEKRKYDKDVDYQQRINEAVDTGDFLSAAQYERQRNEKISGEGMNYTPTNKYQAYQQAVDSRQQLGQQLDGRQAFSYNAEDDPLFRQYREMYLSQGSKAMQDTMGMASSMTGGYGNSYAQTAGQSVYNEYAGKVNDKIPELYQLAYAQYQDEGDRLQSAYDRANAQEQLEYNRLYAERDRNDQMAIDDRNWNYQTAVDDRNWNYQLQKDQQEKEDAQTERTYNMALTLLSGGQMPGADMLAAAGISEEVAKQLYYIATGKEYRPGGESGNNTGGYVSPGNYNPNGPGDDGPGTMDIADMAANYYIQHPNVKIDSRALDMWLARNGIEGKDAQTFKEYLQYAGATYSRG